MTAPKPPRKKRDKAPKLDKKNEHVEERWHAFAREYVKDFNGARAAAAAGYAKKTAAQQASRLLTNVKVQEFINQANARKIERAEVSGAEVVQRLNSMLMADARELVEVYVSCCRYCYGIGHGYQRTLGEWNAAREKWLDEGKELSNFDEKGGIGYDARKQPLPECPECFGQGQPRSVLKDTRHISAGAAHLFAGVKVNASGAVVPQLYSQLDVAEKLMRHHGMYLADNKQKGGNLPGVMRVEFVDAPEREHDPLKDEQQQNGARK